MLTYYIYPQNTGAHLIAVEIHYQTETKAIDLRLPRWIPGSYKIRDYSRFLHDLQATDRLSGAPLPIEKIDNDSWRVHSLGQGIVLRYVIYAFDLSVRGAYFDDTRCFFNHTCVSLNVVEAFDKPRQVCIRPPKNWQIFTTLPSLNDSTDADDPEYQTYWAKNYDEQIDCPVEIAPHYALCEFETADIPHRVLFTGQFPENGDYESIAQMLQKTTQAVMAVFAEKPRDLNQYLFMNYIEQGQYGGLEHKNNTAQMASPEMILKKNQTVDSKVLDFISLCTHEYFHLFNVKRLRPKDLAPYDLSKVQTTGMLWFFEGITSYYDELLLNRAGVMSGKQWLERFSALITRVNKTAGRHMQSLHDASFDAWTKLYQADASSPNFSISYYQKGALFACFLDLWLRKQTQSQLTLDTLLKTLWQYYGKQDESIDENMVWQTLSTLYQNVLPDDRHGHEHLYLYFKEGIHGTQDFDFKTLLNEFSIDYALQTEQQTDPGFSIKLSNGKWQINQLDHQSEAAKIGISVDDVLLAIDAQTADNINFEKALFHNQIGSVLTLLLARRGRVFSKTLTLNAAKAHKVVLTPTAGWQQNALLGAWLNIDA